ncbi:MAG: flagellar assembly protein FliH [Paraperlucidibaca sp.]
MSSNATWARWHMPSVDGPAAAKPVEEPSLMSEAKLAELHDTARREGWEQGLNEGRTAAKQELEAQVQRWQSLMSQLAEPLAAVDTAVQTQLLDLTMALATQLAQLEISVHPEQVLIVVREAIALLPSASGRIRVQLHPDDLRFVEGQMTPDETHWQLIASPSMGRGGVQVSTENTHIDERFETRLARTFERLIGQAEPANSAAEHAA